MRPDQMVKRMSMPVVVHGAGLAPAVADVAGGDVTDSGRRFELGVEFTAVDLTRTRLQPPQLVLDLLVGRVQGKGRRLRSVRIACFASVLSKTEIGGVCLLDGVGPHKC